MKLKRIIDAIRRLFIKPSPLMKLPETKSFDIDIIQADLIKRLLCDEMLDPAVVAAKFFRRYPRRHWRNLWDHDPIKDMDYLTEPDLFVEGCELGDAAMRKLGHVVEEDGKEYLLADSPFLAVLTRAFLE